MKLVLDTNVVAAALLGEAATAKEAVDLLGGGWELWAPALWKAELANVVWKAVRLHQLAVDRVEVLLGGAEALPITSVETQDLWNGAVARSIAAVHPVYDTLFVELAVRLGTWVASYDRELGRRFPDLVRTPGQLLAGTERT